jgi:hypothetical protein
VLRKSFFLAKCFVIVVFAVFCAIAPLAQQVESSGSKETPAASTTPLFGAGERQASQNQSPTHNLSSDSLKPKIIEDWTTPLLKGSDLKASDPIVGEIDVQPGFTRELTRVQWRPADPIDLYIIKPTGVKKPPVILYLYSYPFETDRFLRSDFCRFLTQNGFAAVGFASALTGQRYHDVAMTEWFVSDLPQSLATSAHDVQMILNYLATRSDLDLTHVGMFGDGSGATIAILAAAVDSRIQTLDLLDPWGDWPDWIAKSTLIPEKERPGLVKPDFLAAAAPLDPLEWLPQLKTRRVRIQHVGSVTVTPTEARQKLEAAVPANMQFVRYDNTRAFLKAISGGRGLDWIKEQLQPGAPRSQLHATSDSVAHDPSAQAKVTQ